MLLSTRGVSAAERGKIGIGVDVAYLDPQISSLMYNQVSTTISLSSEFSLRLPLTYVIGNSETDVTMLGGGVALDYQPFAIPLFVSLSMVHCGYLFGSDAPLERLQYLDEFSLGYRWHPKKGKFFIEPSITFFDPSGVYSTEYEALKESFQKFPDIRLSVLIGYEFFSFPLQKEVITTR